MSSVSDHISLNDLLEVASEAGSETASGFTSILDTILSFLMQHKVIIAAFVIVCIAAYFIFTQYMKSTSEITELKSSLKEKENERVNMEKEMASKLSEMQQSGQNTEPPIDPYVVQDKYEAIERQQNVDRQMEMERMHMEQMKMEQMDHESQQVNRVEQQYINQMKQMQEADVDRHDLSTRLQSMGLDLNELKDDLKDEQSDQDDFTEVPNPELDEFVSGGNMMIEENNDHVEPDNQYVEPDNGYTDGHVEPEAESEESAESLHPQRCEYVLQRGANAGKQCDIVGYLKRATTGNFCSKHMKGKTLAN